MPSARRAARTRIVPRYRPSALGARTMPPLAGGSTQRRGPRLLEFVRVWCSNLAHVKFELAELYLSHRIGGKVSRDYNRTRSPRPAAGDEGVGAISDKDDAEQRDRASQDRGVSRVSELRRTISFATRLLGR